MGQRQYGGGGGAYPKWSNSASRSWLNSAASGNFLNGKSTLQGAAQEKTLYTRIQHYASGANNYTSNPNLYETTEDKLFFLSLEETFYTGTDSTTILGSGTTDIATIRTNGSKVLFADVNARKFSTVTGPNYAHWLRTPGTNVTSGNWTGDNKTVANSDGNPYNNTTSYQYTTGSSEHNRPAAWVVQQ